MALKSIPKIFFYMVFTVVIALGTSIQDTGAANNPIGKIVALRGKAVALQGEKVPRVLTLKSPVYLKETIETARGRLQIMFTDNTLITLGRNSKMVLEDYLWKEGDPNSKLRTRIKAGSFRVMGGAITRDAPQNFKTEAPSATIGIRGSMYAGIVQGNRLAVVYQGGKGIYVSNPRGRVDIDRPGFGTQVADMDQPPAPPEQFDETLLDEIEGGMAGAGNTGEAGEDSAVPDSDPAEETADSGTLSGTDDGVGDSGSPDQPDTGLTQPDAVTDNLLTSTTETFETAVVTPHEQKVLNLLAEIGVTGSRATTLPPSGIWTYTGILRDDNPTYTDDTVAAHVNWHNKRLLVFENDPNHPGTTAGGFGIGEITETGAVKNLRLFGSGDFNGNGDIYGFTGSETFGHVYGSSQEALGLTIEGVDYPLYQPSPTPPGGPLQPQFWSDTVAVTFDKVSTSPDQGNAWNGFFMGLAENMGDIDTNRVCFINDDAAKFSIAFDRDAGTFSGTMNGYDAFLSSTQLSNLKIGGTSISQSAYIADNRLGAELSGSNVIINGSGSTSLKPYGNFMVSSMETQLSDNTYWGYWEIAYNEPGTGNDFHVHVPGSLWIAGDQTPATQVQWLIDNPPAGTLSYTGKAMGIRVDTAASPGMGQVSQLTNGTTAFNVNFSGTTISGDINFSEVNLSVTVAAADFLTTGFSGPIFGAETDSKAYGVFFGPNAEALGGNFYAKFGSLHYQGIFAGNR